MGEYCSQPRRLFLNRLQKLQNHGSKKTIFLYTMYCVTLTLILNLIIDFYTIQLQPVSKAWITNLLQWIDYFAFMIHPHRKLNEFCLQCSCALHFGFALWWMEVFLKIKKNLVLTFVFIDSVIKFLFLRKLSYTCFILLIFWSMCESSKSFSITLLLY